MKNENIIKTYWFLIVKHFVIWGIIIKALFDFGIVAAVVVFLIMIVINNIVETFFIINLAEKDLTKDNE